MTDTASGCSCSAAQIILLGLGVAPLLRAQSALRRQRLPVLDALGFRHFQRLLGDIEPAHVEREPPELGGDFAVVLIGAVSRRQDLERLVARADGLERRGIAEHHLRILRVLVIGGRPLGDGADGVGGGKLALLAPAEGQSGLRAAAEQRRQCRGREQRERHSAPRASVQALRVCHELNQSLPNATHATGGPCFTAVRMWDRRQKKINHVGSGNSSLGAGSSLHLFLRALRSIRPSPGVRRSPAYRPHPCRRRRSG